MSSEVKSKKTWSKTTRRVVSILLIILLIVMLVLNYLGFQYQTIITRSLGHETIKTINYDASGNSDYFKSDFDSTADLVDYETLLSQEIEAEGIVLLKNDNHALPLTPSQAKNISIFSINSNQFRYGGSGSGAIDETNVQSLKEVFEGEGFKVNPVLWNMYVDKYDNRRREIPIEDFTQEALDSIEDYNDTAVMVLSRAAHEATDLSDDEMRLSDEEKGLFDYMNSHFDNIIVLVNAANAIELNFLNEYDHIHSALWVGYPGQQGIISIPRVITGQINPSGHLPDTYAKSASSSPAVENFGYGRVENGYNDVGAKNTYVVYGESIYVGYRYYETRYEDTVLGQGNASSETGSIDDNNWQYQNEVIYPFGYGLSYTQFDYSNYTMTEDEKQFIIQLDVTNTGDMSGKDVVQIYFQSPYTVYDQDHQIEKASVELCGYAKTDILEPGQTQNVTLTVSKEELRTYDFNQAKTYVVDAGDYYFTAANDAHHAINNILAAKGYSTENGMDAEGQADLVSKYVQDQLDDSTYAVDEVTGTKVENQFDKGNINYYDADYHYLSRSDCEKTWPSFYGTADEKGNYSIVAGDDLLADSQENHYADDPDAIMPTTASGQNLKLISMRGKAYDDPEWESILDCLTVDEMMNMVRLGGWQTAELPSVSKPTSHDQDGPAGISDNLINSNTNCMGYPIQVIIAATWNDALVEELGKCIGEDGLLAGIQGWYAPGLGTHRTPFGGRNFEYYSEDGFLAGKICAAEVRGVQSKGMYVYLKHLVLNDQEDRRYGISPFVTEQTLRELYLQPFEIAIKEGGAKGVMAAFNGIGGYWCGANESLLTNVLENEWNFRGIVVTDYASSNDGYMWVDMGLQAGCDLWLNSDTTLYKINGVENNPTQVQALRKSSHDILYTVVNSAAMNGFTEETEIKEVLPTWVIWLICVDILILIIEILGFWTVRKRSK